MKHTLYNSSITNTPLETNSVNLIMTSPPYGNQRKKAYNSIKPDEYVAWFQQFSEPLKDCLTEDGSMIINIKENVVDGQRHTYVYDLVKMLQADGWRWVDEYCWHKTTTTPGKWPNRFRDQWERLYHFTLNKKFTMNQEAVMVPIGDWSKTRLKNLSEKDKKRVNSATGSNYSKNTSKWVDRPLVYPSNVLTGSPVAHNTGHPAAYPQWLPEWFIKLLTNEGDTVLDPFIGAGTTSLAAETLGRNSVGFDLSKEYLDLAVTNLEKIEQAEVIMKS